MLEQNEASADKALESLEEHHVAKMVLSEFSGLTWRTTGGWPSSRCSRKS